MSVVGARPEFIQVAPLCWRLAPLVASGEVEHQLVHTGQHYDQLMSQVFFDSLRLPTPTMMLGAGSGSHGAQTAAILASVEQAMLSLRPEVVVVFGDTNSTLAGALAAAKLQLPVAHVEAGLRSFNRAMPEEINRVAVDHLADLLFTPTDAASARLAVEGLGSRVHQVGDIKTEVTFAVRDSVRRSPLHLPAGLDPSRPYLVATLHRSELTDHRARLAAMVTALGQAPHPVLLLVHPRLRDQARRWGIDLAQGSLRPTEPLDYPQMVRVVMASAGVITDSGGLQKEAFLLAVPCTTVRTETEWIETVDLGWNQLCPDPADLGEALRRPAPPATTAAPYGTGDTAQRIVTVLRDKIERSNSVLSNAGESNRVE